MEFQSAQKQHTKCFKSIFNFSLRSSLSSCALCIVCGVLNFVFRNIFCSFRNFVVVCLFYENAWSIWSVIFDFCSFSNATRCTSIWGTSQCKAVAGEAYTIHSDYLFWHIRIELCNRRNNEYIFFDRLVDLASEIEYRLRRRGVVGHWCARASLSAIRTIASNKKNNKELSTLCIPSLVSIANDGHLYCFTPSSVVQNTLYDPIESARKKNDGSNSITPIHMLLLRSVWLSNTYSDRSTIYSVIYRFTTAMKLNW